MTGSAAQIGHHVAGSTVTVVGVRTLLERALEAVAGGAIVLDSALRVVGATASAERVLGGPVPVGAHAIRMLYGDEVDRPIAEALTADRAFVATIARSSLDRPRHLRIQVRATPLRALDRIVGWVLQISERATGLDLQPEQFHGMWTRDATMKGVFRLAERVAHCDASVLLDGEMGTGKASLAAAIHALSPRKAGPYRSVNCSTRTPRTLERQLFGHADAHATPEHSGAAAQGILRTADGGTVLLDNVGDLPPDTQASLLRVLESGTVTPVDGGDPVPLDVRVVAATHRSFQVLVASGRFRADLMYRLRMVSLHLPPLRARHGDVPLLVDKFVAELNSRGGRVIERVSPGALERLERHNWPGNVRELRVALESAFATGDGPTLTSADLPPDVSDRGDAGERLGLPIDTAARSDQADGTDEATRIRRALERASGDRSRAAALLGISRTTLWRRMRALGFIDASGS